MSPRHAGGCAGSPDQLPESRGVRLAGARHRRQQPAERVRGCGHWNRINLALRRLIGLRGTQNLELRIEAFNLLNTFIWGNPTTNLGSGQFGRITGQAGDPRIMQFGVKYGF